MPSNSTPRSLVWLALLTVLCTSPVVALQSDRQQPLEVNADATDGTLGDGVTVLRGRVEIRQGSLHIKADRAEVDKLDGRVRTVVLRGEPAFLEQEIEQQGLVQAQASTITYQVASGLVTLEGTADVHHPQYQVSGDQLTYDLNQQHFQGSGDGAEGGRIRIRLDPEMVDKSPPPAAEDVPDSAPDESGDQDG
jgi:lipopolysaccharide export system protein LptA